MHPITHPLLAHMHPNPCCFIIQPPYPLQPSPISHFIHLLKLDMLNQTSTPPYPPPLLLPVCPPFTRILQVVLAHMLQLSCSISLRSSLHVPFILILYTLSNSVTLPMPFSTLCQGGVELNLGPEMIPHGHWLQARVNVDAISLDSDLKPYCQVSFKS